MKFITYLQEEYCDLFKSRQGIGIEIYTNPTKDDIKEMFGPDPKLWYIYILRFTADVRTKKLFVWNAKEANHDSVVKYLISRGQISPVKESIYPQYDEHLLNGICKITDIGKLIYFDSDDTMYTDPEDAALTMKYDWSWLKQYMLGAGLFIKDMKKTGRIK